MVEQNVGYWVCGGNCHGASSWSGTLTRRVAAGQRTGKTVLSRARILLVA